MTTITKKKNLIEMTEQELREEIGRLTTTLDKVHQKNRRRKRALKEMNHAVLKVHKDVTEIRSLNRTQSQWVRDLKMRAETAESELSKMAKHAAGKELQVEMYKHQLATATRPGFFARLFGRTSHANQS